MEKKTKLKDPKTYWSKLEQEKLGCCPMLFSAYKKYKEQSDVK